MAKKKSKGLSASCIKMIALVSMFIDHFAASIVARLMYLPEHPIMRRITELTGISGEGGQTNAVAEILSQQDLIVKVYEWMRHIGRISFPIYCFFIVEGFYKTRDRKKYFRRLAACALLSEIPFDLAIYGKVFYLWHQNVFFSLLIGLVAIWAMDAFFQMQDLNKWSQTISALCVGVGFSLLALILYADYFCFGVLTMVAMYLVRKATEQKIKFWQPVVFLAGIGVLCMFDLGEAWALLALPLLFFYRGKKGWNAKWFFYLFYPVHLLVLAVLALCLGIMRWGII